MTISEFIYAFDDGSVYAEYDEQGNVYIYDNTYDSVMAQLGINSFVWEVEDDTFTMSPSLLRLMAELADTPPDKRKEIPKYVILNGDPIEEWSGPHEHVEDGTTTYEKYFAWRFFLISDNGKYLKSFTTDDPKILANSAYTVGELEDKKRRLPGKLRKAVDNMLTPLDVALEGKA